MSYKNKKIIIFGLGNYKNGSGISAALFFAKHGANLLITDLKIEKELASQLKRFKKFSNIEYVLGRHRKNDFKKADFVFKNPGIPKNSLYLKIAKKHKIPIINDWTVFFGERPDNFVIGVTGTKGKSVKTALIYHILKKADKDAVLCGNMGQSPLSLLNKIKKNTIVVAELSSWLLSQIKESPQIAVVTNLMPDHLDKYKNLREYYRDKERIFKFQKDNDYLILDKGREELKKFGDRAKSKVIYADNPAISVAKLLKISSKTIKGALKTFKGVEGRLEFVVEKNGVRYYNDTCATMPEAVIFALGSLKKYKKRIILIAGGMDKNLDYKNLAQEISKNVKALILLEGTTSEKIKKFIPNVRSSTSNIIENVNSMEKAVRISQEFTAKGDIVLLSPGAASFNLFKNEHDRGKKFKKLVL